MLHKIQRISKSQSSYFNNLLIFIDNYYLVIACTLCNQYYTNLSEYKIEGNYL